MKHPIQSLDEPWIAKQALQVLEWCVPLANEFNALLENGTWELAPPSYTHNCNEFIECTKHAL